MDRRMRAWGLLALGIGALLAVGSRVAYGGTLAGVAEPALPAIWRLPGRSTPTGLYLFLRALGHPVSYDAVAGVRRWGDGPTQLGDLATACSDLGVPATAGRTDFDLLRRSGTPAILHMDPPSGDIQKEAGYFVVYLGCTDDGQRVMLFEGSAAHFLEVDTGDFLQGWTGHALVAQGPSRPATSAGPYLLGIGIAWLVHAVGRRLRRSGP